MWTLIFPDGYEEFEGLSEAKGWVAVVLQIEDGRRFTLNFATIERAMQDATEGLLSDGFYFERNLILVPTIDRDALQRATSALLAAQTTSALKAD